MKAGGKPKNLKQNNSRAVFELLRHGEKIAVAEIAEKIRLSKTTIKKVFDSLLADGLISMCGKGESTDEGGKKPELYRLNPQFGYVIAIHVTPDEVRMATTDLRAEITWREIAPVGVERSFDGLVERFATTIEAVMRDKSTSGEKLLGVVLVLTGLVDPDRGVSIHSFFYPDWGRDAPVVDRLRARLGADFDAPLFIDNTNRYQAVAESEKGLAGDYRNLPHYAPLLRKDHLFCRIVPTVEALDLAEKVGVPETHIVAAYGPYTRAFNSAVFDMLGIDVLVIRDVAVDGGLAVCLRDTLRSKSTATRCALKPAPTMAVRMNLMVSGLVALSMAMASLLPGRKLFLSILRSRLRIFMVTSPKSILTGQGLKHLWQTVQWSATSSNSCQCLMDTPRRVCSS